MPGQDILQAPDPSTVTVVSPWWHSWTIKDLAFQVDGSVPGSFPHRWPGKWFDDTKTTSGSAVISTTAGQLSCGDVGQAIQINGAGAGGGNLVTTIASVTPCWASAGATTWQVVTLAANAQASLTNAHTYVSLLGLPVTTNIGNCAIAAPMYDSLQSNWHVAQDNGINNDVLENVTFQGLFGRVNTCGMFTQGNQSPYQIDARMVNFTGLEYGVVQTGSELNSAQTAGGNDFQHWDHVWMFSLVYPWITYNGGGNALTHWQLSTSAGPQILGFANVTGDCPCGWTINTGGFEIVGTNTGYGVRIEGTAHTITGSSLAAPGTVGQINASQVTGDAGTTGGTVTLGGQNIQLTTNNVTGGTWTDKGRGNKITATYNPSGVFGGQQVNYPQSLFPYKGESQVSNRFTANFIRDGNFATPYNWDDLLIWPQDFVNYPGGAAYSALYVADATSPSGAEWILQNSVLPMSFAQFASNSFHLTAGTNIPAGKVQVYYSAKCLAATGTFTLNLKTSTNAIPGSDTENCTTTLQTYHFTADLSTVSGQNIGFIPNTSTNILVAWIALRPNVADVNGKTIAGAGATILTGPATSVLHNCAWFTDTVGTIGDSGNGCAGGGLSGQTTTYLPKATSATGSTASSAVSDDGTTVSVNNEKFAMTTTATAASPQVLFKNTANNMYAAIQCALTSSRCDAAWFLDAGTTASMAAIELKVNGSEYWRFGMNAFSGTPDWDIRDGIGGKTIVHFPSNTMPTNSISGNASGATAITQPSSDNSTNIATDAFVKANLPLAGTTSSIGGSALALGACTSGTVSVAGATTGMAVVASPTTYPGDGMDWRPYVSSAGTVTVKVCAAIAGTPTASTYNVRVIQ
jgi:hypothetical protein